MEATEFWNDLAALHIIQCSGMFAGGSASRIPTGVRSPKQEISIGEHENGAQGHDH
jgi:hypothetical protein